MDVFIGKKVIKLNNKQFLSQGGEGKVYKSGDFVYKIYIDSLKMMPIGKFNELKTLTDDRIITPINIVTDKFQKPIGYQMKFIKNRVMLNQLFPRIFCKRNNITHAMLEKLVQQLHEIIMYCHQHNVLLVDLNESNFIVSDHYKKIYAIDTDSYQTKSYPATAIMSSIRDWHATTFSELTDWFSFGILSFWLFTGIHPFKGKYKGPDLQFRKKIKTDKSDDAFAVTKRRMQHHISVFDKNVSIPNSASSFKVIPTVYKDWYTALFVDGKRVAPPNTFQPNTVVVPKMTIVKDSQHLYLEELFSYNSEVVCIHESLNQCIIQTKNNYWLSSVPGRPLFLSKDYQSFSHHGFSMKNHNEIFMFLKNNENFIIPIGTNVVKQPSSKINLTIDQFMFYNGCVYAKSNDKILELSIIDIDGNVLVTPTIVSNVLEHATTLYPGVAIQNIHGSMYVSIYPYPKLSYQVNLVELYGYQIIDAKFDTGVLMVIGFLNGKYSRFVFRFSEKFNEYDCRVIHNIQNIGLNFITLDTQVVICLNEDEKLEVFSAKKNSQHLKIIKDDSLRGDVYLSKISGKVVFFYDNKVYKISMKR